jgi:uncharacterized protein
VFTQNFKGEYCLSLTLPLKKRFCIKFVQNIFSKEIFMKNLILKLLIASTICLTLSQNLLANTYYYDITGLDPFIQKWTDTSLLAMPDNWTEVVSAAGYRGDLLTAGIGVNPQTILNDTPGNTGNLTPNETNPNTSTTDGIVEFETANPVVSIRPSDTANAPNLVIRINSTGCLAGKTLTVAYEVRDIDGSARNSVSPIALQYRYSAAGDYINLPDGYVADATFGPNSDTKLHRFLLFCLQVQLISRI